MAQSIGAALHGSGLGGEADCLALLLPQAADAGADGADGEDDAARWLLDLRQLRHPLLMAKYMKALVRRPGGLCLRGCRQRGGGDDSMALAQAQRLPAQKKSGRSSGGGRQAPARSLSSARQRLLRNSMVAKSLIGDKARSSALASEVGAAGSGAEGDAGEEEEEELREPVASDLRIRKETRALVITGETLAPPPLPPSPNTHTFLLFTFGSAMSLDNCRRDGTPLLLILAV